MENNESLKEYVKNSILKPYLIHVEFEVMNILSNLEMDKMLKLIYQKAGFNLNLLINTTDDFLHRLRNLIVCFDLF